MSDRVETLRPLMERGIPYDEALRRIAVGDVVHERGEVLRDAVDSVQTFLCLSLDGPVEFVEQYPADEAAVAIPKLDRAWREFRQAVDDAQQIAGEA
jgi:hypothetical protein